MKTAFKVASFLALSLMLSGCFEGSDFSQAPEQQFPVDFTNFVKTEVQKQAVDLEPVDISKFEFSFNDQKNEQAFDSLL